MLEKKYASEVSQQQDVFSSEQGPQRQKDFRSVPSPSKVLIMTPAILGLFSLKWIRNQACCTPAVLQIGHCMMVIL